jgi:hypothetical protein
MTANKYTILFIIFLIVMPFKMIFGQDMAGDTTETEADRKYDSVMAKAAKSFSDSSYDDAIAYYKEAGKLKPQESYPAKMIIYVEATSREVADKRKREDELKRKNQIQENLAKANTAILDKDWSLAKSLFNEILSLHPNKGDEDFAKSKIQAIDLELQRIALRTPVKEEPKPVYVPKTRREARAMRKQAERNAILARTAAKATTQQAASPVNTSPTPALTKNNSAASTGNTANRKISYQILQRFNEDFKDVSSLSWSINSNYYKADFVQDEEKVEAFYDANGTLIGTSRHISTSELPREAKKIFAAKYSQYNIKEVIRYEGAEEAAYYISTQNDKEKVVFKLTGSKDITVFTRELGNKNTVAAANNITPGPPGMASSAKNPVAATRAPGQAAQQQTGVQSTDKKSAVTTPPPTTRTSQQPPASQDRKPPPPATSSTTAVSQLPGTVAARNTPATTPPANETARQQTVTRLPGTSTSSPAGAQTQQPPSTTATQQKPAEGPPARNTTVAAPSTNEIARRQTVTRSPGTNTSLPSGSQTQQTPSTPVTQQKPAEVPPARNTAVSAPSSKQVSQQATGTPLPDRRVANTPPPSKELQAPSEETNTSGTAIPDVNAAAKPTGVAALRLSDSSDYIKMICQDISFIGTNIYTKVLIQNYSEYVDFPTDTLLVSLKKNNGTVNRLDQRFISNFPVVPPLGEFVLVSLAEAPAAIAPDDTFIIEMKNKLKKTKLTVQVPWERYSQSKNF